MVGLIEDYAVIGNCETMALVGRDGSVDWLCLPRFDSAACFAALLGDESNGRWQITPAAAPVTTTRRYRDGTLVLETIFETDTGAVMLIDCMSRSDNASNLLRRVRGLRGTVAMRAELTVRFDYGISVPWVSRAEDGRIQFVAGPDRLMLQTSIKIENKDLRTSGCFKVEAGEEYDFSLGWSQSYHPVPPLIAIGRTIENQDPCPSKSAARATGITAIAGCAMPP